MAGYTWNNKKQGQKFASEKGGDFTQALLGHRSSSMTDKYRDGRGREWKDI
ncbi:integrase encoded by prophage CP-933K%3B partial [Shigella sonnei]|nr:integrase encoded by prophage CP-933K%3B partial [Shigella sonnei]